jgi:hypothetical protein
VSFAKGYSRKKFSRLCPSKLPSPKTSTMEAGLDTMTDQSQTIIDDNPIGNDLDKFHTLYEDNKANQNDRGNTIPLYCSIFL